jgi:hypothetical protein
MTEKHLELAVFTERHRESGESWPALRDRWNAERPLEKFATKDDPRANRFARDCRNAWSRVTGLRWPAGAAGEEGVT